MHRTDVSVQSFFPELISCEVAAEKGLKIRTAQNVKVPRRDAAGGAFISP